MNQKVSSLAEGQVTLQWPATISPRSFKQLKAWLEIITEKVDDASKAEPEALEPDSPEAA